MCATNRAPISYELTPANTADLSLAEELVAEAGLGGEVARKLLGDLAYRSQELEEELAELERGGYRLRQCETAWTPPADRDRLFESQADLRAGGDIGHHVGGIGHEDRSQDDRLHLRLSDKQNVGTTSRAHQGALGMNLATHI